MVIHLSAMAAQIAARATVILAMQGETAPSYSAQHRALDMASAPMQDANVIRGTTVRTVASLSAKIRAPDTARAKLVSVDAMSDGLTWIVRSKHTHIGMPGRVGYGCQLSHLILSLMDLPMLSHTGHLMMSSTDHKSRCLCRHLTCCR